MKTQRLLTIIGIIILYVTTHTNAQKYHWQEPNAIVLPTGDLQWQPKAFEYPVPDNQEVRYIDYENGNDGNDGQSKATPWKHHPWDTRATGKAAQASGPMAYVFKRGVTYRIYSYGEEAYLQADESGTADMPIRLTTDPTWGKGDAEIAGSQLINDPWQKATVEDVPPRMNPENIWFTDVDIPRKPQNEIPPSVRQNFGMWGVGYKMAEMVLFEVAPDGSISDLHIASDVGWNMNNPNFAMHHWNQWDGEKDMNNGEGKKDVQGYDDDLIGFEPDYFDGGTLWSQYGWIIGTPTPYIIEPGDYDPERGILAHRQMAHPTHKGVRYLVENLPQLLDKPGEYYFDQENKKVFLRLPKDRNPNESRIELASAWNSLIIHNQNNIEISGLSFRFNGRKGTVIDIANNSSNISIKNCQFEHLASDAIYARVLANEISDNLEVADCDFYQVNGGTAICLQGHSGKIQPGEKLGILNHVKVLRNRTRNTGIYRHNDSRWSNVPAIVANYCRVSEVAGNIVDTAFGSGIVAQGGKSGKDGIGYEIPLIRILVHHNKMENTALGVNDYGGLSLWQHGPIFSYSNVVGNAVGHWPAGFFGNGTTNLSYPIYLDGGFKIYNFNNISWARPFVENDPYTSNNSAYFNVFGYLNPFVNNTVYGSGSAFGGTSGNRNDYLGNILTQITNKFISVNHGGNPSLIGGDDPGTSGIDGATTLAYGNNIFYGNAKAGTVATVKQGAQKDLDAAELDVLISQMQDYPLRYAQVGKEVKQPPLRKPIPATVKPSASDADFRPASGSAAIDYGIEYFVPWALYATIAEWHFNENHSNPGLILDYHHYPTEVYFDRSMYYKVPVYELEVNNAGQDAYVSSPSETWAKGALLFDGDRFAKVPDKKMKSDVLININEWRKKNNPDMPAAPWISPQPSGQDKKGKPIFADDQFLKYPGEKRITPDMGTNNFLLEANLKIDKNQKNGTIISKHDGSSGYALLVNEKGQLEFVVAGNGISTNLTSKSKINNGEWVHLLAEFDRKSKTISIYLDGKLAGKAVSNLSANTSLSNSADLMVGCNNKGKNYLRGAIDFMRISLGTLADAETDIAELYEWQTNGPVKYDFAGNKPQGRRDAGALEKTD